MEENEDEAGVMVVLVVKGCEDDKEDGEDDGSE